MTDIVERLRGQLGGFIIAEEAADEIERLKQQLAECATRLTDAGLTIEQLWNEIKVLKDKLGD